MEALSSILIEVSSRKGSYLTGILQMKQSTSTCLRIVSSLSIPVYTDKEIIGIDDWAFRKGITYGSILVDAETGCPIDLLNSRDESVVTSWLKDHPEIKIMTRDRASSYSKAIATALPACIQIADKFHIVKNLSERIYEVVKKQYVTIKNEFISFSIDQNRIESCETTLLTDLDNISHKQINKPPQNTDLKESSNHRVELYDKIHELHNKGISERKIAALLCVHRETVRHYLRHKEFPKKRIVFTHHYEAYLDIIALECGLRKRIKEIFTSIKQLGFKGKITAFYSWFHKNYPDYDYKQNEFQKEIIEKKKPDVLFNWLSPRKISIYISNPTWGVSKTGIPCMEYSLIQRIIQSSPLLQQLKEIITSFKNLLRSKKPEQLDEWMDKVRLYKIADITFFVNGLKMDIDAVKNAITYSWNNGFVEGNVNRLKTKKREMYGRASFELLRRKVVLSKMG